MSIENFVCVMEMRCFTRAFYFFRKKLGLSKQLDSPLAVIFHFQNFIVMYRAERYNPNILFCYVAEALFLNSAELLLITK